MNDNEAIKRDRLLMKILRLKRQAERLDALRRELERNSASAEPLKSIKVRVELHTTEIRVVAYRREAGHGQGSGE